MNTLSTLTEPLGWALLHFLWQGTAIALLLRGFLWLTRRRSPQVRYAAAGAAMLLMLGAAVGTVYWQWPAPAPDMASRQVVSAPVSLTSPAGLSSLTESSGAAVPPEPVSAPAGPQLSPGVTLPPPSPPAADNPTTADRLRPLLPWMVGVWAAGVLFFSLRLLNGWRVVRRWRATAEGSIPGDWAQRFACLCKRLGITRTVRLLSSATLAVPVVIGWMKPVVLVPASLFTGLSAAQLEALLMHELAHVRRHDYLVNLLQSALETLFFYHPAVWWASGQLRREREHCCDDTATAHAGGVIDYARALTALEEMRAMPAALGISAAGGSLLQRIRRLAGVSEQSASGLAWPLGLLTLAAAAIALPFTLLQAAEPEKSGADPGARVIRGLSLSGVASTVDAIHITDLYEPDPGHPGMVTQKFGVFEMPIYGAAGEPWLKYPAGSGAFYIELKGRTYGPIPGDPMEKLKLTDLLREKLKEEHPNDALLRLRKMIYRGDDALRFTAYALMQELTEPKWRFDCDELITTCEEALKKAPAPPSAASGAAALAHVKSLADAAKTAWENSRVTVPDSDYQPGENAGNDAGIIWTEPDASGMSLGCSGLVPGAIWRPDDQIEFTLWIRNDSKEPVKFSWTPRMDEGLRMWATDEKGVRRDADIMMNTSLLVPNRTRLELGQKLELKKAQLLIVRANEDGSPPARDRDGGWVTRLALKRGMYQFQIEARIGSFEGKDGEGHITVPAAGEWTGTLLSDELRAQCSLEPISNTDKQAEGLYLKAYLQLLEADKLSRKASTEDALKSFKTVALALDQIARDYRKWQTDIVEYRRVKVAETIVGLEKKLKESGNVRPSSGGGSGNKLAAIVNGRPLLKSEVDALMKTSVMDLLRRITNQTELAAERKKLRSRAFESLIDQELILLEYALNGGKFGPELEAQAEELIGKQFVEGMFKGDRRKFLQELDDSDIRYSNFLDQQKKNVAVEMMLAKFVQPDKSPITAEEKAAWLKKHGDDMFRTGEKLKLSSITIPGTAEGKTAEQQRALADEVRASLVNGADFAAQARTHSTDSKRDASGSWDWVEKKDVAVAVWRIVSTLETGKISEIVSLQGSFYIFLVEARQEGKMKPQNEIDLEVEQRIWKEMRQQASDAWLKKLREKATIKIFAAAGESDQQNIAEKIAVSEEFQARAVRPLLGDVLKGRNNSKHEQTAALLKLWRDEYKEVPVLPAEAMQRLAAQVKEYIEKYPGEAADKMKAQLPAMEKDSPWAWEAAQELIDALCDAGTAPVGWMNLKEEFRSFDRVKPGQKWIDNQHAKLAFGPAAKNGLRAAWAFDPKKDTYPVGDVLKCHIILHNSGKEPLEFRTGQWHQLEQLEVHDAAGNKVEVKTSFMTGISPWFRFKLEPGQVCEVGSHGIVIGKAATGGASYGVEIPARPGDELTCQRGVNIEWGTGSKDGSGGEGIPHYLTTGDVKFKVVAPDPNAAPKVGAARPSAVLQFRVVAGPEEPDTEPVEPMENWSELPTFHLRKTPVLTAADVKSATAELDKESGRWQINLVFSEEGAAALAKATKENIGRQLAIVGNGKVISAPVIQGEMGKQVMLTGNYLESEAKELANAIQAAASARGAANEPAGDRNAGELVIDVAADGSISLDGEALTLEALKTKLTEIAKQDKKRPVIIRGDTRTRYEKIISILNLTHEAGLYHVSFATKTTVEGDRKSVAEKLLEDCTSLDAAGKTGVARAKLKELTTFLGKPGDPGFHEDFQLILSDAEMAMGRLDRQEADLLKPEIQDAKQTAAKLRETALNHFSDAAKLLLVYDQAHKESVPCRTRLASAYVEMGGVLQLSENARDASVAYGEAVKIYTELLQEEPGNASYAVSLAKTYDAAAELSRSVKHGDSGVRQALEYQQFSATLLRPLAEQNPKALLQLAASLKLNGDLHQSLGDTAAADAAHKEAKSLLDSLSDVEKKSDPQDGQRRTIFPPAESGGANRVPAAMLKSSSFRRSKIEERDDEIRESTYDKDDQLLFVCVAYRDEMGRHRLAVICDGKMNPQESILYFYNGTARQLKAERHFDMNGQLIREVSEAELKERNGRGRFIGEVLPFSSVRSSLQGKTNAGDPKVDNASEVERLTALATGFYDAQQFDKARETYERALLLDPLNAEVRGKWFLSEAMLARQANPFAVPTHPDVLAEARRTSISLTVKDTEGRKTMPEFRVIAGVRSQAGGAGEKDVVNWQPHTLWVGTNGGMMWPLDKAYDEMALRVEADGYMPQVFAWLEKKKGPQDLFFQLTEDKGTHAQILTPDGTPAAGATVAIAMVQRDAVIEGGKLRHDGEAPAEKAADRWRLPRLIQVDAGGGFMLPAENDPTAAVLVVHLSGVREMSLVEFKKSPVVTLQPWARIEGKVQWGEKAGGGQKVSLTIHRDTYGYPGVIAQYEKTTAAADGSFVFEKVLPGQCQLSCPIEAEPGNKSGITEVNMTGQIAHVDVKPGTNQAVIGGGGRTVKGKLTGRNSWEGVTFHFHPTAPHVGFPGDDEMWKAWGELKKSASGPLLFREGLKVMADGTFEITGVLPGSYQIFFKREGEDKYLASGKFSVEAEVSGKKPEALDAGEFPARK